jgi:serine/threonine protein kinase
MAGRMVGEYALLEELGRGGMGIVYKARQEEPARIVAVKELASTMSDDARLGERFIAEARTAAALSHPNIVIVHDYLDVGGSAYIVMEYFERGCLRPLVSSLTLAQLAGVFEGLLSALTEAERLGIVHRDLKPENLLVSDIGEVKIGDFGLAKAIAEGPGGGLTMAGMVLGTPAYMAPEQAMDTSLGPWTDLYSAGAIAYELLVGRVPFPEDGSQVSVLLKHVQEPPPPPRSLRPELDPELAGWVLWLLAKSPSERPANAEAAWVALEDIVLRLLGPRWREEAPLVAASPPPPDPPSEDYDTVATG